VPCRTACGELRVTGKGNKQWLVPFDNGAFDALADWLQVRGSEPGPLSLPVDKADQIGAARMTPHAVFRLLQNRAARAKVKDFSPHDLRPSFISGLRDAGADPSTVQALARHASTLTTVRHDRRGERAKRRAVRLLHVPYSRREAGSTPMPCAGAGSATVVGWV
jgi:integrase